MLNRSRMCDFFVLKVHGDAEIDAASSTIAGRSTSDAGKQASHSPWEGVVKDSRSSSVCAGP